MRSTFLFATLLVAVAIGALVFVRNPRYHAPTPAARGTVTLVGDSLNVGIEPYIGRALPGWKVVTNDRVGRATPEGIAELEAGRATLSNYVVVSLGTNDPPTAVTDFRRDVRRVLALIGPNRCIVWATIWRDGAPSAAFNEVLREAAAANQRLQLVGWAEMVERHPELLAADGLHGNEDGYRERAGAVAAAARGCAPARSASQG
jgi:GDSL-like Lipase/Acylhydrolase family